MIIGNGNPATMLNKLNVTVLRMMVSVWGWVKRALKYFRPTHGLPHMPSIKL